MAKWPLSSGWVQIIWCLHKCSMMWQVKPFGKAMPSRNMPWSCGGPLGLRLQTCNLGRSLERSPGKRHTGLISASIHSFRLLVWHRACCAAPWHGCAYHVTPCAAHTNSPRVVSPPRPRLKVSHQCTQCAWVLLPNKFTFGILGYRMWGPTWFPITLSEVWRT